MKKIVILGLAAVFAAGCGVANNFNKIKNNMADMVKSHPHKVADKDIDSVLASGMGIVDIYFGKNVQTAWKKINDDATISKETYKLTYFGIGATGRRKSKLEPGTYFLNGVHFFDGNTAIMTGTEANTLQNKAYGWDEKNNKAYCFAFTLKAGQLLEIPDVVTKRNFSTEHICPLLSFANEEIDSEYYYIGDLSK